MGGLGQLVSALIAASEGVVPHWMWPAGLGVFVLVAAPSMLRNMRTDAARKLFRTATRLRAAERVAQEDEALRRVAGNRDGLVVLADLALQEGRPRIVPEVLAQLGALGGREPDLRRLHREVQGPQPATSMEAVLLVERLVEHGLLDEAERRLLAAIERWPTEPELLTLQRSLSERKAASA
jgi:hypothetical protein